MEIISLSKADEQFYSVFVQNHPYGSLFQSLKWREYQERAFGLQSNILIGGNNGAIRNAVLLFVHPLPFRKTYLYTPRGPLFSNKKEENDKLLQSIQNMAQEHHSIFLLIDPLIPSNKHIDDFTSLPFKPAISHQPKTTLLIDLTKPEEEILSHMKEKGRYNIRLAEKKGVVVRSGTVPELYPLLLQTSARDTFHIHSQKVYQTMMDVFGSDALLLVAEYDKKIIAGAIFLFHHKTAVYYYGASSNEYRNLMAPYLVQWRAIEEAKRRGCITYDFLGIAEEGVKNHPWAGVTEFKLKFGGEKEEYIGAYQILYNKFWTSLYHLYKKCNETRF